MKGEGEFETSQISRRIGLVILKGRESLDLPGVVDEVV